MKIDIHAHLTLKGVLGKAGRYGPTIEIDDTGKCTSRIGDVVQVTTSVEVQEKAKLHPEKARDYMVEWRNGLSDPTIRIAEMDEKGIDIIGVTIPPLYYLYWAEPEIGIPFARTQNEELAKYVSHAPSRFFFMATLPLQDIPASVKEADYAIGTLGARGINVAGGDIVGMELDNPALFPVYEKLSEYDAPLFIHPYPVTLAGEARHPLGLDSVVGYPYQEMMAFVTLLYGGVMDEFPDLKVCIAHGGGFAPYQFGRMEVFQGPKGSRAKRPLREYLNRFYFDNLIHDVRARKFLVEFMGSKNVVVGDNYSGMDSADGFAMLDELNLPAEDAENIRSRNALELFHLEPR